MIDPQLALSALHSLGHHKLRSVLTMLGMVFGVGAVIGMLAISEGARSTALAAIADMGLDRVLVRSVPPTAPVRKEDEKGGGSAQEYGLTFREREHLVRVVPAVSEHFGARETRQPMVAGSRSTEGRVIATEPLYARAASLATARGRFIAPLDLERRLPVAVLGHDLAAELFPLRDPIGRVVSAGGAPLRVVGVLAPASTGVGGLAADDLNRACFVPETSARAYLGLLDIQTGPGGQQVSRRELTHLVIRFAEGADVVTAGALVRRILARTHDRGDVEVVVPLELLEQERRTRRTFTIIMGSIAGISLLVGGIGIMNIMLASVLERTREIGIRRAVGARRRDILLQFLVETVAMSVVGGSVGILLGLVVAVGVNHFAGWPIHISAWSIALSVGISVAVGLVFGLSPAMTAARMQPVEALRHA